MWIRLAGNRIWGGAQAFGIEVVGVLQRQELGEKARMLEACTIVFRQDWLEHPEPKHS